MCVDLGSSKAGFLTLAKLPVNRDELLADNESLKIRTDEMRNRTYEATDF